MKKTKAMKMHRAPTYESPSAGTFAAVVAKITDLGEQSTAFGPKFLVRLRFELEEKDSAGRPKFVARSYTNSLHPKSNFAKFFAEIGHPLPEDGDIDTNSLVGTKFSITLVDVLVEGKKKMRITGVAPLKEGNV
jgi:hypothetical protein